MGKAKSVEEATQRLIASCYVERAFEVQVRGKDFDDAIWAHYVAAITERRSAVDALRKVDASEGLVDIEEVGMGL